MSTLKKTRLEVRMSKLRDGIESKFPDNATVNLGGTQTDKAGMLAKIDSAVAPFDTANSVEAKYRQALADREQARPDAEKAYDQLALLIRAWYGNNPEALAAFGLKPRKERRQLSGKELVAAATKAKTTRVIRGTKGSKQKAELKATGKVNVSATFEGSPAPAGGSNPAPGSGESGSASGSANGAPNSTNGGNGNTGQ